MLSPHVQRLTSNSSHRRSGLLAATETTVIVAMLVILCWGSSRLTSLSDDDLAIHAAASRASSDRPVYRLTMEETGNRLWVFRPSQEVTALNLTSGQIDKSRSSLGVSLVTAAHSRDGATSLLVLQDDSVYLDRQGCDPVWYKRPDSGSSPSNRLVVDVDVSDDGSIALIALSDGTVRGWNAIDSRAEVFAYQLPHPEQMVRMCLDGNGLRLFASFRDGSASLHETMTGRMLCQLPNLDRESTAAAWSDDGQRIAVAGADGSIVLLDAASGQRVWQTKLDLPWGLIRVTVLALSPDSRWLAAGGLSTQCHLWDVTSPDAVRKLSGHDGLVRAIAFSPHAKTFFTGGFDGTIREWSLESFTSLRKFD